MVPVGLPAEHWKLIDVFSAAAEHRLKPLPSSVVHESPNRQLRKPEAVRALGQTRDLSRPKPTCQYLESLSRAKSSGQHLKS